MKIEVAFVCL